MVLIPLPSILSIIFHMAGRTDWWNPNQTSLPPPRGWSYPSGAEKKERPTGVYLQKLKWHVQYFPSHWVFKSAEQVSLEDIILTYHNNASHYEYMKLNIFQICEIKKQPLKMKKHHPSLRFSILKTNIWIRLNFI